jgi:hypothetical protein
MVKHSNFSHLAFYYRLSFVVELCYGVKKMKLTLYHSSTWMVMQDEKPGSNGHCTWTLGMVASPEGPGFPNADERQFRRRRSQDPTERDSRLRGPTGRVISCTGPLIQTNKIYVFMDRNYMLLLSFNIAFVVYFLCVQIRVSVDHRVNLGVE